MSTRQHILLLLLAVLITAGIYYIVHTFCLSPDFEKFFEFSITAFSILIGFLFTTVTLLTSYRNEQLDFIRKSGGMPSMYASLKQAIYSSFVAVFLSILYFLFSEITDNYELITYSIVAINIVAMLRCVNFTQLFLDLMASEK